MKGQGGPSSDIDVLVVSQELPLDWIARRSIRTKIKSEGGRFSPFQLHLATPEEYDNWYKKFIKEDMRRFIKKIK